MLCFWQAGPERLISRRQVWYAGTTCQRERGNGSWGASNNLSIRSRIWLGTFNHTARRPSCTFKRAARPSQARASTGPPPVDSTSMNFHLLLSRFLWYISWISAASPLSTKRRNMSDGPAAPWINSLLKTHRLWCATSMVMNRPKVITGKAVKICFVECPCSCMTQTLSSKGTTWSVS